MSPVTPRRLLLVRHAKAEPFASSDHERRLTERGVRDALAVGEYLRDQGLVPDHVVVSTAVRARATWDRIDDVLASGAEVVDDGAVYSGSTDVVLEALRSVPAEVGLLAFVGHQPTVGHVAHLLDDGEGDHEALRKMLHGFPTCSVAVFEVDAEWQDLDVESGRLVDFLTGSH